MFEEHDIYCLPYSYTNDPIELLLQQLGNNRSIVLTTLAEWHSDGATLKSIYDVIVVMAIDLWRHWYGIMAHSLCHDPSIFHKLKICQQKLRMSQINIFSWRHLIMCWDGIWVDPKWRADVQRYGNYSYRYSQIRVYIGFCSKWKYQQSWTHFIQPDVLWATWGK